MADRSEELLQRAADAAYAAFYPGTIDRTARGLPAWKGEPDRNPLLRPLRKALAVLDAKEDAKEEAALLAADMDDRAEKKEILGLLDSLAPSEE